MKQNLQSLQPTLPGIPTPTPPKSKRVSYSIPTWFPTRMKNLLAGQSLSFKLTLGERKCWRKKKRIPPSVWAVKHRVLHNSSLPGPWHNEVTPYIPGIMDASFMPSVQHIVICKSPQTGGSEGLLNCVGYIISHSPGPVMLVYPDELMARENARDRLLPMLETSRDLRQFFTGKSEDTSSMRINLLHMALHMAWSGSASRLANKPIRYLVREEIDKWQNSKGEASSLALAKARTTTWGPRRKIWDICTPTTEEGPIWQSLNDCEAIFDYWVTCPSCGASQLMSFEGIKFFEKKYLPLPGEDIDSFLLSAWYECEHCKASWDDAKRDKAVLHGHWQERQSGLEVGLHVESRKPTSIGFHIPSWLSRFVSLEEVAQAFRTWQKTKNLDALKDFKNRFCAEPWVELRASRTEDRILSLADGRPRGIVPGLLDDQDRQRVAALVAGVDTQGDYLRYVVRAFGWGETQESWMIQAGALPSWEALEQLLFQTQFLDSDGKPYMINLTIQDAMGNRTFEAYQFAAKHKGLVLPYQGQGRLSAPIMLSPREFYPGADKNIKIPGGVNLLRCDTHYFKSQLSSKLGVHPGDPGTFWLHQASDPVSGSPLLDEYAKEMCVEYYDDEKNLWVCPKGKANHYWDCEVMCLVGAYQLDISNWIPPWAVRSTQPKKRKPKPERPSRWG